MADQVILFQDANFHGAHKHVFDNETSLKASDHDGFNDRVSSIVILSGNWQFFRDPGFQNPYPVVLGPGLYDFVGKFKISNDDMSSLTTVLDAATIAGDPLNAHAVLFEHGHFHGDHRHIFSAEPNLPDNDFNDVTSSIVVEQGNWSFFRNSGFDQDYGPVLGRGIYPSLSDIGISNDDVSSLQPTDAAATISNSVDNEVLLFEHDSFHGAHKHVFSPEPNLNAADDDSFNDAVSSVVVLQGTWNFFSNSDFSLPYGPSLGPGTYSSVSNQAIVNEDMSSLRPAVPEPPPGNIILFKDANFHGPHKHVFNSEVNLNTDEDNGFNDNVSSLVIFSGSWRFFKDEGFISPYPVVLGPGLYDFVGKFKINNDDISSLTTVLDAPTIAGDPLDAHAILFEHAAFHGDHRHVFNREANLPDNGFNDVTSSIVVEQGNWSFFRNSGFDGDYGPVLGRGIYPSVNDIGISNDDVSSLLPTDAEASLSNSVENEVLLFEHGKFRGSHKHVFTAEPNLNASDDNIFNDVVSSLVVLRGDWSFYADADFVTPYVGPVVPGTYPTATEQNITNDDMSSLRRAVSTTVVTGNAATGQIILFEHANFHGRHRHIFNSEDNLNASEDSDFNDMVSSIVVVSGNWQFFRNAGFDVAYPPILGPGIYSLVSDVGIANDNLSSLQIVQQEPTVTGMPLDAHIVLFEHADLRGGHKHVFAKDTLDASDDDSLDDKVSSIVVLAGNWVTFAASNFDGQYSPILGLGRYRDVRDIGITNDDLSSLQPTDSESTVTGSTNASHAMLFEHSSFRGAHKHVFAEERDLNASEDDSLNDAVSSIAILSNQWRTYRDAGFRRQYDVILDGGPDGGLFPFVTDVGITNDDMSSLSPAGTEILFDGIVTIKVDEPRLPDPLVVNTVFTMLFFSDTRLLRIDTFPDIAPNELVTVSYQNSGIGSFPSDGTLVIPDLSFKIAIHISVASDSTAQFSLSTDTVTSPQGKFMETGSPADATGNIVLVGAGTLAAGSLDGEDFSLKLSGTITPRPA
jgi:hypothetical protein